MFNYTNKEEFMYLLVSAGDVKIIFTEDDIKREYEVDRYEERNCVRPELHGQPKIKGFNGPMWGGRNEGKAIIRYESYKK
ncbi:hypothetical protein [Paenibacillus tepidiphilus]|uniref:hypothetical protein n=1 Tax=Paenibacillus tepidiphilus TaxID=2608683 RepID=UPI001239BE6D|nr:hypothetical protein [Paenibacillus tepidiphilus]